MNDVEYMRTLLLTAFYTPLPNTLQMPTAHDSSYTSQDCCSLHITSMVTDGKNQVQICMIPIFELGGNKIERVINSLIGIEWPYKSTCCVDSRITFTLSADCATLSKLSKKGNFQNQIEYSYSTKNRVTNSNLNLLLISFSYYGQKY